MAEPRGVRAWLSGLVRGRGNALPSPPALPPGVSSAFGPPPSLLSRVVRRARGSSTPDRNQLVVYPLSLSHIAKPWQRPLFQADWLGQYTPPWVMFWVLKLMRDDPQISLGMGAIKSVFFGIDYRYQGGDPAARAFLNKTVIEAPWFDRLKLSILNALDFGFQSHEILWALRDVTFQPEAMNAPPVTLEEANVVRGFVDLDPEEIAAINVDKWRNLDSISLTGALQESQIPADKLLHSVHQYEFANWWGNSMLRRAYNPWLWCNHLYGWMMRYLEGKANPPYVGTAPADVNVYDNSQSLAGQTPKSGTQLLTEQMLALRGGGAAALPHTEDSKGNNKWKIEVLQDSGRTEQFVTSINHLQALKLRALYLPDRAATQDTATGSFAMADAHIELFLSILEGIKRHVMLQSLTELGHKIVRANFGRGVSVPQASASDLSRQKHDLMADLVKQALDVPATLDDGREYDPRKLINWNAALTSLNVPHFDPREVAKAPAPPPAAPPPGSGHSASPTPPQGFPKKTIGPSES